MLAEAVRLLRLLDFMSMYPETHLIGQHLYFERSDHKRGRRVTEG